MSIIEIEAAISPRPLEVTGWLWSCALCPAEWYAAADKTAAMEAAIDHLNKHLQTLTKPIQTN